MEPVIPAFFRKQMLSGLSSSQDPAFLYYPFVFVVKHMEIKEVINELERKKAPSIHLCFTACKRRTESSSLDTPLTAP